ncbi:MAG: glycosyltransferase family 4 protein [Lachnospiraceae bacterium]|nr:glycosyltransferase family 4 protein [Lachnospiraceae bacterium]
MKLLVFGTGDYYQRYKKWLVHQDVVALLDNSPIKQNTLLEGKEVLSPQNGICREFDAVVIMSFYVKDMKAQMKSLGVAEEKIYHFFDLRKLINLEENRQDIQYYGISRQEIRNRAKASIALLSTDLAFGGTALALFHMAKALHRAGYPIIFASTMDGPLRKRLEMCKIPVVVDPNLQLATMRETDWLSEFRLIICNSINYYTLLIERDFKIPVIWWLHDSAFFYDGVDKGALREIPWKNLTVLSVGPIPEKAIHEIVPELPIGQLLYGVEDSVGKKDKSRKVDGEREYAGERICFVTIGYIEERKGQDILLQAVSILDKSIREKTIFYLVGQDTSLLAGKLKEQAETISEVVVTGPVGREELESILNRADVMICPSREDPMPTVAAEAMMHSVPCIVSNVVGTAAYIQEEREGLIFESENAFELSAKIKWCVENRDRLERMGRGARQIYERKFSMDVFEKKLIKIVEEFV